MTPQTMHTVTVESAPSTLAPATVSYEREEDDVIDLGDYLGILLENKWQIAAVIATALAIGALYAFLAPPVYRADALLQVEEESSPIMALEEVAGLFSGDALVPAELEILRSRMVLGQVVENLKLNLVAKPDYLPVVGPAIARVFEPPAGSVAKPWLNLPQYAWGGEAIGVESFHVPDGLLGESFPLIAQEGGRFQLLSPDEQPLLEGQVGETASGEAPEGGEIRIFLSSFKARPGTRFLITKSSKLKAIEELVSGIEIGEKGKQSGILSLGLTGTDQRLIAGIVNEITDIYVRQNVERRSAEAEQTLVFLEKQLPPLKTRLEAAEAAYNAYRLERGSVDLAQETRSALESIVRVEGELIDLQQERDEKRQKFTPAHPVIHALDLKIGRLEEKLAALDTQVEGLPDTQQIVLRLARDVEVNTNLYTQLLNTSQELRVAKAGTVGNVRLIDYAVVPEEPIRPRKAQVLAMALVLGAFLGVLLVLIKRTLTRGIEDPSEIESKLGLPIYANVPRSLEEIKLSKTIKRGKIGRFILATSAPDDPVIESLRSLRTALHFGMMGSPNGIVHITGPSPGCGKSFVSINLAAVLASMDKRVLVIDADLRKGHLHRYAGVNRGPGLSEVVSGQADREAAIHRDIEPGLDVLTTGRFPPNPSELLLHPRFKGLLQELSTEYDQIIVDSPPILAVTDPAIIGQSVGVTLMVVKWGQHPLREIDQAVKRLAQGGVRVSGVVFNDIEVRNSRYGERYVYQYSYGSKSM